jgi:hypothetical protein
LTSLDFHPVLWKDFSMSAVASIVLADALVTPVNHTFVPLGQDKNGVWWFEDQSPTDVIGYNRISVSMTRPPAPAAGQSSKDRVIRVKLGLHCPVAETLGTSDTGLVPAPTLAYINRSNQEYILSERSTLQNRMDTRKFAEKLNADPQVIAMVENLLMIY